jgi:hypothetical protein
VSNVAPSPRRPRTTPSLSPRMSASLFGLIGR